ncbi:MAG: hypothetical protein ACREFG_11260, partial [Chthoniobacterales bacterium]
MVKRISILLMVCGLAMGGCKKGNAPRKNVQQQNATPATAAIAAVSTPTPAPSKPPIDQSSEVVV